MQLASFQDEMHVMSTNSNLGLTATGVGMAAGPSVVDIPFYESEVWLTCIAIIGFIVLILTGFRAAIDIAKGLRAFKGDENKREFRKK